MGLTFNLVSPMYLPNPTKAKPTRRFSLNLNVYRNTHHMVLNKMKVEYKKTMKEQIDPLIKLGSVEITYTVFPPTVRLFDVANVCSVIDKFFCDALVDCGKIGGDDFRWVPKVTYQYGELSRDNPRVEIEIKQVIHESRYDN